MRRPSTVKSPPVTPRHPAFAAGQACDAAGCHDKFKHQQPYAGAAVRPLPQPHELVSGHLPPPGRDLRQRHAPAAGLLLLPHRGPTPSDRGCGTCHDAPHDGWTQCTSCHTTLAWDLRSRLPPAISRCSEVTQPHLPGMPLDSQGAGDAASVRGLSQHPPHPIRDGLPDCATIQRSGGSTPSPGFPHSVFFSLVGAHKKLDCTQCHKGGVFGVLPRVCVGCHGSHHGGLTDCADVTPRRLRPVDLHHSSVFPLTGRHRSLACSRVPSP